MPHPSSGGVFIINPATKYVVFRASSQPLIKAIHLASATSQSKGRLAAPNRLILKDRPKDMLQQQDPVGSENNDWLRRFAAGAG
jgi:hypothetical protein